MRWREDTEEGRARRDHCVARWDKAIAEMQARFDHLAGVTKGRSMTKDAC